MTISKHAGLIIEDGASFSLNGFQLPSQSGFAPRLNIEGSFTSGSDVNGGWMGAGSTRMPQGCFDKAEEDGHVF